MRQLNRNQTLLEQLTDEEWEDYNFLHVYKVDIGRPRDRRARFNSIKFRIRVRSMGFSMRGVLEKSGISYAAYYRDAKNGEISIRNALKLAKYLKLDLEDIIDEIIA